MKDELETNINMDNKDHIVLSCDTLSTTVPETRQNLQMSTLTEDNIECVDKKESYNYHNNCEDSSEHVQSSEYVNYYDNECYVVEQLKTEFPEDVIPQSDCSLNTQIHSENEELLKCIAKAELNNENVEDRVSLNIKEENDYQFIVKTEGLEMQEDTQCKFYDITLKNGCNLLQNSNKHVKDEITTLDNGITELHQCKYCGKEFDNYNNILVHISNNHKQEKPKCDVCGKQFKSIGNLNRHILAFHKLEKRLEPITKNCVNCHVHVQQKYPLNDHSNMSCFDKEGGEDESENKVTRNLTNDDNYKTMLEYRGKQYRSPIHLRKHQKLIHQPKIPKTKIERFQCGSCKKSFTTKGNVVRHINSVHFEYGRKFKCWCMKEFRSPRYLRQHERLIHKGNVQNPSNGKFQCDYCTTFFNQKRHLFEHIKALHFDYGKRFACWCGKQFRSPIHLRRHERSIHRPNVQNTNNDKYQCESCKKNFAIKRNLARHIKTVHFDYGRKFECWCGKEFRSPIHLSQHDRHRHNVQNSNNDKFQCDYCKTYFKLKRNLLVHIMRIHYVYGKWFSCWCGKQFRSPQYLRRHEIQTHRHNVQNTNDCEFQCDYCKKIYRTKLSVARHIKTVHFDYGRKFQCWCGKQFRSPLHLKAHERLIHKHNVQNTDNVKFQCDYCKSFFKTKAYLCLHIKRVHHDYGKRFDCWCGKQFRSPIHLREHKNFMKRDPRHANPSTHNVDQLQALEVGRGRKTRRGKGCEITTSTFSWEVFPKQGSGPSVRVNDSIQVQIEGQEVKPAVENTIP